jgi:hypothetical protein
MTTRVTESQLGLEHRPHAEATTTQSKRIGSSRENSKSSINDRSIR